MLHYNTVSSLGRGGVFGMRGIGCHSAVVLLCALRMIDAEVMIIDEGFTQRSRAAHVETQRLHQVVESYMTDGVDC